MNERDSEQVAYSLIARGHERVAHESAADVVLLNTCSVRDMADQKAIGKMGMLGRMARDRPHVVFGLLGCMAQARGASLLEHLPHVDLVIGTQKFHRVADCVDELLARKRASAAAGADVGHRSVRMDDPRYSIVDVAEEPGSQETIREQQVGAKQATAFVSIMQGCNMRCAFCIVPQTRGQERSRSIPEIVREVRGLIEQGIKEVTLLGQIVNLYGQHELQRVAVPPDSAYVKAPFVQLLEAVHESDGLERLRFTSPHPIGFRQELVEAFARLNKLAEHVHLPLQSGSNRILKAMRRAYTAERYVDLVHRLRKARPGLAITTDIIVGFPGETDADYQQTRDLVQKIQFDNAFVFRYSPRRHTPAADMAEQVPEQIKEERNRDLLAVVNQSARHAGERLVGRDVEVLCEGPSKTNPARLTGRTRTNKVVVFEGGEAVIGELVTIAIQRANGFSLYGRIKGSG